MQPYRIKSVEPLPRFSQQTRKKALIEAGYNTFLVPAKYVTIDLVSDSGTGAMTANQWAAMLRAREDFSGQESFEQFVKAAQDLTGFNYIQPVHQGRGAESMLFELILKKGDIVLANNHFETTRANIEAMGCHAIDLPSKELPFLGNIDIDRLRKITRKSQHIKLVILTLTSNIKGGQPASLENIEKTREITRRHRITLVFDACRFADNAYFIKENSKMRASIKTICRHMFDNCDIAYLSNKKDGLVNIGGFIALRNAKLHDKLASEIIRREAYPTSGGLAARDLAAMTLGLSDAVDEDFLRAHISSIRYLAGKLKKYRVDVFEPVGGHGVVILPKKGRYSAFALAAQVFIKSGIRGGVFEHYLRLAIPRRVYTREHLDYVAESIGKVYAKELPRLRLVKKPRIFFNFFAQFTVV